MSYDVRDLIKERICADPVAKFLMDRSNLTRTQLDTYLIDRVGKKDGIRLSDRIRLRNGGPVKKGAFLRTLKQAHKNLEKSICTVILAEYLGLLDKGTILGLVQVGDLISSIDKGVLSKEQAKRIIEALIKIIQSLGEGFL